MRGITRSQNTRQIFVITCVFSLFLFFPSSASANSEDGIADFMSWVAIILGPAIGITVFLLVHIMPEKIAEKKNHPQAMAIKTLCLLSLFFGGLLWPLAWLWAYSKPVLYKMAYGTDKGDYHEPTMADLKASQATESDKSTEA